MLTIERFELFAGCGGDLGALVKAVAALSCRCESPCSQVESLGSRVAAGRAGWSPPGMRTGGPSLLSAELDLVLLI